MITIRNGCVHIRWSAVGFVMQTHCVLREVRIETSIQCSSFGFYNGSTRWRLYCSELNLTCNVVYFEVFAVSGTAPGCSVRAPGPRPPTGPSHSPTHVHLSPPSESGAADLVLSPSTVTDRPL
jgi:hypothetical protein